MQVSFHGVINGETLRVTRELAVSPRSSASGLEGSSSCVFCRRHEIVVGEEYEYIDMKSLPIISR